MSNQTNRNLLIVFAKNPVPGKVKTRLAKEIGEDRAFQVYQRLLSITETVTRRFLYADVHIYFTDFVDNERWSEFPQFIQSGTDLGERMAKAFEAEFNRGYDAIVGIGTDLPEMNTQILEAAFKQLKTSDTVFGPANDGGYYLLGMKRFIPNVFENKSWSTPRVLEETVDELKDLRYSVHLLTTLNDIDTLNDLRASSIFQEFLHD